MPIPSLDDPLTVHLTPVSNLPRVLETPLSRETQSSPEGSDSNSGLPAVFLHPSDARDFSEWCLAVARFFSSLEKQVVRRLSKVNRGSRLPVDTHWWDPQGAGWQGTTAQRHPANDLAGADWGWGLRIVNCPERDKETFSTIN